MTDLHGMTLPTCDICVNGQKRKLYGKHKNKVYLHNGDNFQLKFFNPLQERIGVQLNVNGIKVDNDLLVLNPGQEITIERYIGTNRKLTFNAYDIDTKGMSEERVKQAVKAIEKNGVLEVVFWAEKKVQPVVYSSSSTIYPNYPNYTPLYPNPNYQQDWYNTNICSSIATSGCTTSYANNFNVSGNATTANLTVGPNGVTITGDLKINGTLDINNGQLKITSPQPKNWGTSGTSGSSGTSGCSGTSGHPGNSFTSGTCGGARYSGVSGTRGYAPGSNGPAGTLGHDGILYMDTTTNTSNKIDMFYVDYAPQEMSRGIVSAGNRPQQERTLSKKIETGRIEKGGVSNQYFSPIAFEVGDPFYRIKFKLLPFSLKPVKKKLYDSDTIKSVFDGQPNSYIKSESAIREYCKCGYRISRGKGLWDFCPRCGRKVKK